MIQSINTFKLLRQLQTTKFLMTKVTPLIQRSVTTDKPVLKPDKENWTEIYRLPMIRLASAFNKLKVYQTLLTAIGTPVVFALQEAGHVEPNFGIIFAAIGVSGVITLTICSFPVRNLIGFVYMNDEDNRVKLSYVDFWGRRKDQELVIDDIFAQWELPPRRFNVYQQVKSRQDESQSYKLLYRFGVIKDPQRYFTVFGEDT